MFKQASTGDIVSGRVTRDDGYIAIVMRHYPRFLRREFRDEYIYALAPPRLLFEYFRRVKVESLDHEHAFSSVQYEDEFWLEEGGIAALKRLARRAEREDVYLICQCDVGQSCHRELLMLMARELFGASIEKPRHAYPRFLKRLKRFNSKSASRNGKEADRAESVI